MTDFFDIQGKGINQQNSLYIRLAALATVPIMLVISAIAGPKTGKVSNKYDLIITPPGPFFAIWGVIYLGLITSGIYLVLANVWSLKVTIIFAFVNLLNGLWVYIFNYATQKTNNICAFLVILMAVLNQIQWIQMEISFIASNDIAIWNIINRNIFAFYQGWLVAASNLNIGVTLVYSLGISKKTQTYIFWIMCPLCIVFMILLNLSRSQGFINNIAMYFSAVYALFGAYLSTKKKFNVDLSKTTIESGLLNKKNQKIK